MATLKSYRTSADASKKITTYILNNGVNFFALDFDIGNIVHWVVSLVEEKVFLRLELKKEVL